MKRAGIWISVIILFLVVITLVSYFFLPGIIEAKISEYFYENIGYPLKVDVELPVSFIFTGRVKSARLFLPTFQLNGLIIRQFDLKAEDINISVFKTLLGRPQVDSIGKIEGTAIILPADINDFFEVRNMNYTVEIKDNEIYVTTNRQGPGEIVVSGKFNIESGVVYFEPENLVKPKLLSVLVRTDIWKNVNFSFDLAPADSVFEFDRIFIGRDKLVIYFTPKKTLLNDVFKETD